MQEYAPSIKAPFHPLTMHYLMNEISAASCINMSDTYYHELWTIAAYNAPNVTNFITRLTHDINARLCMLATSQFTDGKYEEISNRHITENRHWIERCEQVSNALYEVDLKKEKEKEGM